jgi:hypothetical protein
MATSRKQLFKKEASLNWTIKRSTLLLLVIFSIPAFVGGCSPEPRAILGQIDYEGTKTGNIYITAQRPGETGLQGHYTNSVSLGSYNMIVRTGTYTVSAYVDINDDFKQDADEPYGFYDGNEDGQPDKIVVKGEIIGIDFVLYDP